MKYKRITSRNEEPFYAFNACKECEQKDGCDKWCAYTVGAYTRLHELEDKIENGELISTVQNEQSEQEIEFFVEHNAAVRKQAVEEFATSVKLAFYYEFDELIPSIMADKIDALVKEECGECIGSVHGDPVGAPGTDGAPAIKNIHETFSRPSSTYNKERTMPRGKAREHRRQKR